MVGDAPQNPTLVAAMRRAAASGDGSDRQAIYAEFANSVLMVPIRNGSGGEPEVRAVRARDGRPLILGFTNAAALESWADGPVRWATIRGVELARFAVSAGARGLVLDPGSPFGGELSMAEITALSEADDLRLEEAGPVTRLAVRENSHIELRRPREVPEGLRVVLRSVLARHQAVARAYVLESQVGGRPHLTLGVLLGTGTDAPDSIVAALADELAGDLPAHTTLDVMTLDDDPGHRLDSEPVWEAPAKEDSI